MSEQTLTLSPGCVLNAFYVWIPYLLSCSTNELHLADISVDELPVDLRLHDFQLRYHLDGFCLTQAMRTVHAVRHAAYHYTDWSSRTGSDSIEDFTQHTFGSHAGVEEVRSMVIDGQRLERLEHQCQNMYVGLVVALDWRRFQTTADARLIQLSGELLCLPAVQSLLVLLRPEWPRESFGHYHGASEARDECRVLTCGRRTRALSIDEARGTMGPHVSSVEVRRLCAVSPRGGS